MSLKIFRYPVKTVLSTNEKTYTNNENNYDNLRSNITDNFNDITEPCSGKFVEQNLIVEIKGKSDWEVYTILIMLTLLSQITQISLRCNIA